MQAGTTGFSNRYNPLALLTQNVSWTDLNGDGVPQGELGCIYLSAGCEINLARSVAERSSASPASPTFDPDIKRMYNIETSVSVQHEIMHGRVGHRRLVSTATTRTCGAGRTPASFADFTPFTLFSPIDGTPITYYNVSAAKASQLGIEPRGPRTRRTAPMRYNGFEYNFNARLPHGITLFGGGMSERMLSNSCDDDWNPNLLLYCDQSQSGLPFRTQFKIAGSVPVELRHPGRASRSRACRVICFGTSSVGALTGVSGPSGAPTRTSSRPERRRARCG